jgi:hypothetical protein
LKSNEATATARTAAEREREAELKRTMAALEARAAAASADIAEVNRLLAAERARNAELMAWREAREQSLEQQIVEIQSSSIENALSEIDTLEREYRALEQSSLIRQDELLARIDALERAAVTREGELAALRATLAEAHAVRARVEAREAEREQALKEANAALAAASEDMARQLAVIRREFDAQQSRRGTPSGAGADNADLAPAMAQREATAQAARDVERLRRQIADERTAYADRLVRETRKAEQLETRLADLDREKAAAAQALAAARQAIELQQQAYATLQDKAAETEKQLRTRINAIERSVRELTVPVPVTTAATARVVAPPPVTTAVTARVVAPPPVTAEQIAAVALTNKTAAMRLYERLPTEAVHPPTLLRVMADMYREAREFGKALALYERVLAEAPGDIQAERKLVMTLFDMGRYDDALDRLAGPASTRDASGDGNPPPTNPDVRLRMDPAREESDAGADERPSAGARRLGGNASVGAAGGPPAADAGEK